MGIFDLFRRKGKKGVEVKISKSEYEKHAEDLMEKVNDALSKGDDYRAAWLYQLLARLCMKRGEYDKSIDYLMHGVECSVRTNKDFNTGWLYRIASNAAIEKKDYPKAIDYALKAVEYFRKSKCVYAMQWSYNLAARASELGGDFYSAIDYYRKSLAIEGNEEIEKKLKAVKEKIPHPAVKVSADKERVDEGEGCRFTATAGNKSDEILRGIRLADREGKIMEKIDRLYPGDVKTFSYECKGKLGTLHSRYRHVLWQGPQGVIEMDVKPVEVMVVPNIGISTAINPKLRLGKPSDFIILIKNNSSSPVFNVKFHMSFPREMVVRKETQESFDRIPSGDEKGIVYTIIPTIVGEAIERDIWIEYRDGEGNKYKGRVTPVVFREALKGEPLPVKTESEVEKVLGEEGLKHLERARKKRGYIQEFITANPMSESEYLLLTNKFYSCSEGFSLGGVSMDTISNYIVDECSVFTLIGMRESRYERLFLFSGRSQTEMRTYLLTAAVNKDGDIFNVLFKAYSEKKPGLEDFLKKITDIVKYIIITMNFAREVEKIEVKKVINIIDSIVQRSNIGGTEGEVKSSKATVKDSVVQRSGV